MNHSHFAHDCTLNNKSVISAGVTLAGHVVIGERFIGIELLFIKEQPLEILLF